MRFLPDGMAEDVVVLSIREPWASVTASGHRTVDSRPSSTAYRGPVVLHAANRVEGAPNSSPRWAELLQAALADGHARPYRTLGRTSLDDLPWPVLPVGGEQAVPLGLRGRDVPRRTVDGRTPAPHPRPGRRHRVLLAPRGGARMNRSSRLQADPAKARAWQERAARAYAERQRTKANEAAPRARERKPPPTPRARPEAVDEGPALARPRRARPRRNDGPWRAECIEVYGEWCRNCLGTKNVQMDHVWPRSQGGPSVVENGLPLCGPFGNGCHDKKTAGALKFQRSWFTEEQIAWLADVGWVAWDDDGQPHGRGWKHFDPAPGWVDREKGGEDG